MENNQSSFTAFIASFSRAYHSENDDPKIFNDTIARQLMTDEEYNQIAGYMASGIDFFAPETKAELSDPNDALKWVVQTQLAPNSLARARYCEDMLMNAIKLGAKQYVILGAGMDTFAYRSPELLSKIDVFEVDHPDTQKFKKQKVEQAGWDTPENLHYVPMNFTKDSLSVELKNSSFDTQLITFFSWLGVTYYLSKVDNANMIKTVSALSADGSSLLFDCTDNKFLSSDVKRVQNHIAMAKIAGEPMQTGYGYGELEELLAENNFLLYEHLTTSDIEKQFFANRNDYLHAFEHFNYALAVKKATLRSVC